MITEHEVLVFILGAAAGSIVTYYNLTREKRIISKVRLAIDCLGFDFDLPKATWLKTNSLNNAELATDADVLRVYRKAQQYPKGYCMPAGTDPIVLTARIIFCQAVVGLNGAETTQLVIGVRSREDFRALVQPLIDGRLRSLTNKHAV